MAVVAIKTSNRCKICSHARRADIDALLELRSRGEEDADGNRINLEYVLARMGEMGVENPTPDNIKSHWGEKKHSYPVKDGQAPAELPSLSAEQMVVVERVLGPDVISGERTATPEELLELQRALFPFEVIARIREGKPLGITWDQMDRGINTSTRRSQEEKQGELVGSLAAAIEMSAGAVKTVAERLPRPDELDGEAIEDADVVPVGELPAPLAEPPGDDG